MAGKTPQQGKVCKAHSLLIDAHVHLPLGRENFQWFPFTKSRADFFSYLKRAGVGHFLAFPIGGPDVAKTNQQMFAFWRKHPDLVTPSVHVNPREPEISVRDMKKYRDKGVVWVSELTAYMGKYTYYEPGFDKILAAAEDLGMIVNVHLLKKDELQFPKYFERHRKLAFVLPHLWDDKQLVIEKARLVSQYPNVYVDLSGYGVDRLGLWEYAVNTMGVDKVLWGSDYPINDPAIYAARLETLRIPSADKQKIRCGNFIRLTTEHGGKVG